MKKRRAIPLALAISVAFSLVGPAAYGTELENPPNPPSEQPIVPQDDDEFPALGTEPPTQDEEGGSETPALPTPAEETPAPPEVDLDAWFSIDAQIDPGRLAETAPDDSVRTRTAEFDADAAVTSLVAPEDFRSVTPGDRVVVDPLDGDFLALGVDQAALDISVREIALVAPATSSTFPAVEVLGESDAEGNSASFVFEPDAEGSYAVRGSIETSEAAAVEITAIDEYAYRLDELEADTPAVDASADFNDAIQPPTDANDAPEGRSSTPPAAFDGNPNVTVLFGAANGTGAIGSLKSDLSLRVAQTNNAFAASRMSTRIVQMDTVSVNFTQNKNDMGADLFAMQAGKGAFGALQKRRDSIGADLVHLIVPVNTPQACGIAYLANSKAGNADFGYGVTAKNCLSSYTLAHEIGHNLGSHHDRSNASGQVAAPYAYGYSISGVARDIMAYECSVACNQKAQFANPSVDFIGLSGRKSGTSTANAARIIDEIGPAAARYRSSVPAWDVPKSHQFYKEINWLVNKKIATGYSDGTFRPAAPVTREAMAAFLYRYAGQPSFSPPAKSPFPDVPKSHKFYKEITWMRAKGITTGNADGTFGPGASVTREAMSAFLYRYAGKPAFTPPSSPQFSDVPKSHKFYKEISWMRAKGIATGNADGTFAPKKAGTRQDAAAFLYRYDSKL